MENVDILQALKESAREVVSKRRRAGHIVAIRRILVAIADILEIYTNFQRDKRWDDRWKDDRDWYP